MYTTTFLSAIHQQREISGIGCIVRIHERGDDPHDFALGCGIPQSGQIVQCNNIQLVEERQLNGFNSGRGDDPALEQGAQLDSQRPNHLEKLEYIYAL